MTEKKIITKSSCGQCKNFKYFDEEVTDCELGRVKEFQADGGLTECEYWRSRI